MYDVIIVGAGPAGLSAALHAKEKNLDYLLLESHRVANSFYNYIKDKVIYIHPENEKVLGKLFLDKCLPDKLIKKWNETAKELNLKIQRVEDIGKKNEHFEVNTNKDTYQTKFVVLAIGTLGCPRQLGIPGEDLKCVHYHLTDPKSFSRKNVLVIGGGNSAIEAACSLHESGANIKISYRREQFFRLHPENIERLEKCKMDIIFESNIKEIKKGKVILSTKEGDKEFEMDEIFIFAGSIPNSDFFGKIGLEVKGNIPEHDQEIYETNINGMYVIGDLTSVKLIKPAINSGYKVIDNLSKKLGK